MLSSGVGGSAAKLAAILPAMRSGRFPVPFSSSLFFFFFFLLLNERFYSSGAFFVKNKELFFIQGFWGNDPVKAGVALQQSPKLVDNNLASVAHA